MTKKIYFLLAFLLTTIGGGNFALATTYELSNLTYSSSSPSTTWSFSNELTISNSDNKGYGHQNGYIKFSSGVQYTIAGIPSTQTITSVTFAGYQNGKTEAWTSSNDLYIFEFNGTEYSINTPSGNNFNTAYYSENIGSVTFSGLNITSGSFTFTPQGSQLDFIITINTDDTTIDNIYSGSYPYTWDFTVEREKWSKSISEMKASGSGNNWNFNSGETEARPTMVLSTGNSLDDIDIIKGLRFTTSAANSLCLDWTNRWMWLDGSVTLPALSRGHIVTIESAAAPTPVPANLTLRSSSGNTYEYFVTAATATPEFAFSGTSIYSIAVDKTTPVITRSGKTSEHLKSNPPTLTIGASDWGNYAFNTIEGISNTDFSVSVSPSGIITASEMKYTTSNGGYYYITLNAVTSGTAHVTVNLNAVDGFEAATPYEFDVRVVQNAVPTKWEFENTSKWTTATAAALGADGTNWQSGTAANEYKNKNKINGTEMYVGETKMTETAGLYITAEKGAIQVNPTDGYVRIGNASRANIVIPNAVAEQTVTFKVKTATAGKDCGIQAASSNLALISGCVAGDVSYYTFRVTSNGDIKFTQTSSETDLFIYYIDLKAATPAASELKFVDSEGHDISNTHVSIPSGTNGNLDNYFKLSKSDGTEWNSISVTFNGDIISADNPSSWAGSFTLGNSTGEATISARTEESSTETGIAVLYVSVKNQPTVTLNYTQAPPYSVDYGQDFNGGTSTVTGTSSEESLTVKYKSSNERVATVDATGHVTCVGVGTATITAYTEETTDYLYAEASYDVTYNSGNVIFQFEPSEVKLALGKNITPFLHYDQKGQLNPESLNFTMSKSGIVTCEVVADDKQPDKNVIKITSVDDASKIGETVIVTASATMKNSSVVYNTTIAVTITAADAVNFDWVKGDDIYVYENTYIPIPGYTGNASGNNHFSNGSDNKSSHHAYYYSISNGSVTWNNQNYKLNEGVPDYSIANDTGEALIFWGHSDNNLTGDTLLVYAKSAGTVTLHAKDSQTDAECTPITIHILAKSGLEAAHTAEVNTISFPYTWDFTKDFSESDFTNSMFWEEDNQGRYTNTAAWMNQDWADVLSGITRYSINFMGGTGAGSPMALFKGMQIELGNSTFSSKIARLRVEPTAGDGKAHLYVNGGPHTLTLPRPGYTNPNTGFVEPSNYQVIIKLKTTTNTEVNVNVNGTITTHTSKSDSSPDLDANVDAIISQNVASGQTVKLGIGNAYVYWIAMTTESKTLAKFDNTTYWASTYSYSKDVDLAKSHEAFPNVTAHYASAFSGQNEVTMSEITNQAVPSGTGMLLKATTTDNPGASYFIANAENVSDYSAPSPISGTNYLKANPEVGTKINANTTTGDKQYTNFTLAYRYKVVHAGGGIDSDYTLANDWSFYRIAPSGITVTNKNLAYLQVPGDLYIDAYSSRRAGDATGANPASQELLKIVFDDDNNTGTTDLDISTVTPQTVDNGAWYTLQGVRVSAPTKGGIYIHNGRKVVIK